MRDWVDVAYRELEALIEQTPKKRDRKTLNKALKVVESVSREQWEEIYQAGPREARGLSGG